MFSKPGSKLTHEYVSFKYMSVKTVVTNLLDSNRWIQDDWSTKELSKITFPALNSQKSVVNVELVQVLSEILIKPIFLVFTMCFCFLTCSVLVLYCHQGLVFLHNVRHLVHRDIKPANLLINLNGEPKITDFGISSGLDNSIAMVRTVF